MGKRIWHSEFIHKTLSPITKSGETYLEGKMGVYLFRKENQQPWLGPEIVCKEKAVAYTSFPLGSRCTWGEEKRRTNGCSRGRKVPL